MVDIYKFELANDEFEKVLSGKKTVHLVVNDVKRKVYAVGNQIEFNRNTEGFDEDNLKAVADGKIVCHVKAEIENLLYFGDIKEAVETIGRETCGFKPSATFDKATDLFLAGDSFESVEKYGIVAIVFKVM